MATQAPSIPQEAPKRPRENVVIALVLLLVAKLRGRSQPRRVRKIPYTQERVLILGASSGIGRSMATQYSSRGARICVVGRRAALLDEVVQECRSTRPATQNCDGDVFGVAADFSSPEDMVLVRSAVEDAWGGLDTLVVAAGVSALQPLLNVAGSEVAKGTSLAQTTKDGIQRAVDVSLAAIRGNYTGPLVAAVTFITTLEKTSAAPSIVLVNSLASVIPAPTRTIYSSTKASSLVLYQALSIEHPRVAFTHFMPSTVEGDFRASAVDSGPVREQDPNKTGLKREDVAVRCISAADASEKTVFMPGWMRFAHLLYLVWPSFVEKKARKKYNFDI